MVKDSGWIRSNHRVELEIVADVERYAALICPPCCPTVANAHLLQTHSKDSFYQLGTPPLETSEGRLFQCMAAYEYESVGLLNEMTETLDPDDEAIINSLPEGLHEFWIEFGCEYGWLPSTPAGPAEYEWIFRWRLREVVR